MKKWIIATVVLVASLIVPAMVVVAPPASAETDIHCQLIDEAWAQDPYVCLQINYTPISSTRKTLNSVRVTCTPVGSFNSSPSIDGYVLEVKNAGGGIVWNTSDANADVNNCDRTWNFANRTVNTTQLVGHLYGRARFSIHSDVVFNMFTYTRH